MCGIAGQLLFDPDRPAEGALLARMLEAMAHRGPDDEGTLLDGPVGLGMRRLSIIDVDGGHQPILNEDESKAVVFNGEIYNYVELREDLIRRGHRFRTKADTEVIVHLYEEKGAACVEELNGMFAFALWDAAERQLMLARDRIGIKPLLWYADERQLLFASEIGSLMTCPAVPRDLDAEAVDDYFTFFYIPGQRSIYRAIRELPPAHTAVWRGGRCRTRRYWQLRYDVDARPRPIEEYCEAYREHLKRAVRLQLRSDVPLGVFLSGGLDSGSVVAAVAKTTGQPCQTFTVGFADASYDESPHARLTAEMYGTEHHEFRITPEDLKRTGDLIGHFGEPYGPYTMVQGHAISRFSRERIKVALAGDGGDELFGGYQTYIASRWARHYLRLPEPLRRGFFQKFAARLPVTDSLLGLDTMVREFVRGAEMYERGGNMAWKVVFRDAEREELLTGEFRRSLPPRDPFAHVRQLEALVAAASDLQKGMYVDLSMFLPDCVLTQTDRMSMAASQEVRVPILDHELIEFAATVPDACKARGRKTKILIRRALRDWLPPGVLNKRKTGFTTPVPIWLRGELKGFVHDVLSPEAVRRTGILEPACVGRLLAEHDGRQADHGRRIWAMVSFMLWHDRCYRGAHAARG